MCDLLTKKTQPKIEWAPQLEAWVRLACYLEVATAKPGNVHPGARFADVSHHDFVKSADVVAPILARTAENGVGATIWQAVEQVQKQVGTNTNLGIILLLAPLCAIPSDQTIAEGIGKVLTGLTVDDAAFVYRAIRETSPGGLGAAEEHDVSQAPQVTLREAMAAAASRDTIAAEYANGYSVLLNEGLPRLRTRGLFADDWREESWQNKIIDLHLSLMAEIPDTLIARKCGVEVAQTSAQKAAEALLQSGVHTVAGQSAIAELDTWLRADGHRRNPGTTADLVAASLFAALREGCIVPPSLSEIQKLF